MGQNSLVSNAELKPKPTILASTFACVPYYRIDYSFLYQQGSLRLPGPGTSNGLRLSWPCASSATGSRQDDGPSLPWAWISEIGDVKVVSPMRWSPFSWIWKVVSGLMTTGFALASMLACVLFHGSHREIGRRLEALI